MLNIISTDVLDKIILEKVEEYVLNLLNNFVDSKSIFVTVNTNFKRQTSMKYAIAKAIVEVNKNTEKGRKNKWKYYSII